MSLRIDRLQLEIIIDNDQPRKKLKQLEADMKDLKKQMKKVPEGSAKWTVMNYQLKQMTIEHDKIIQSLGIHNLSLKELAQRQKELNMVMRNMDPNSAAYKKLEKQMSAVNKRTVELRTKMRGTQSVIGKLAQGLNKYFTLITAGIASFMGIFLVMKKYVEYSAKLSDAMADVRRTTFMSQKAVEALSGSFKKMNTRTARLQLLEFARVAGKLGIKGVANVAEFVKVADMIDIALKKDLGGNTEEAVRQIGKLVEIFKVEEEYGLGEGMNKIASTINALGVASTASEPYMIAFSKVMAGIAPNAGISAANVLGLASTLDQLGQTSEVSATVLGKLMLAIGQDVPYYADLANMGLREFSDLLANDANEALLMVLESSKSTKTGVEGLAKTLERSGVDGQRSVRIIGALANRTDLLRATQAHANEEFEKGTSLSNEYAIKNNTLAANLAKLERRLIALFVSPTITKAMGAFFSNLEKITRPDPNEELEKQITDVNNLVIEMTSANTQEDRRLEILKQLQTIAPDVVEGIDLESVNILRLTENLKLYNEEMIIKLALNDSKDDLQTERENVAKARARVVVQERGLEQQLSKIRNRIAEDDIEKANELTKILVSQLTLKQKEAAMAKTLGKSLMYSAEGMYNIKTAVTVRWLDIFRGYEEDAREEMNAALEVYTDTYNKLMGISIEDGRKWQIGSLEIDPELEAIFSEIDKRYEAHYDQLDAMSLSSATAQIEHARELSAAEAKYLKDKFDAENKPTLTKEELKALKRIEEQKRKLREAYYSSVAALDDANYKKSLSKDDQELLDIDIKYEKLYAKADAAHIGTEELQKKHAKEITDFEDKKAQDLADAAEKKYFKLLAEMRDKDLLDTMSKGDQELMAINDKYGKLYYAALLALESTAELEIQHGEELAAKLVEIEAEKQKKLEALKHKVGIISDPDLEEEEVTEFVEEAEELDMSPENILAGIQAIRDKWAKIRIKKAQENEDDIARLKKEALDKQVEAFQYFADVTMTTMSAITNYYESQMNRELKAAGDNEEEKELIRKRYARKQQTVSYIEAVIQGALGIVKTGANLGYPFAIPYQIAQGIETLSQLAIINSQQFKKGKYPVIGADDGRRYNAELSQSKTGIFTKPTLIEGLGLVADAGNEMVIDAPTLDNIRLNAPEIINTIQTMRIPQYAAGNYPERTEHDPAPPTGTIEDSNDNNSRFDEMISLWESILEANQKPIRAEIVYQDIKDADTEINQIINSVSK